MQKDRRKWRQQHTNKIDTLLLCFVEMVETNADYENSI